MVLILMLIILLCGILHVIYKKYDNPYQLYMIFGKKGSGKSTYLAKIAYMELKKKRIVYTNMRELCITGIRYIDAGQLGKFIPEKNSVLLLDECGIIYDNRHYKSFSDETRDFYKLQRHYKCTVYLASQSFDVDKKLRDLTDRIFLVTSIDNYLSIIRPINRKVALVEATSQGDSRISENLKFESIFNYRFLFIPKYSRFFDSFSAPEKPFIPYDKYESLAERRAVNGDCVAERAGGIMRKAGYKLVQFICRVLSGIKKEGREKKKEDARKNANEERE